MLTIITLPTPLNLAPTTIPTSSILAIKLTVVSVDKICHVTPTILGMPPPSAQGVPFLPKTPVLRIASVPKVGDFPPLVAPKTTLGSVATSIT